MNAVNPAMDYIKEAPLKGIQIMAISLCALINIFEGFDALAIAYTAPPIAGEMDLKPSILGIVFSIGYLGMAIGAFTLGSLSDHIGRRKIIVASLVTTTIFMGLTATASGVGMLMFYRFITGLAIGAMLASITAIAAEYSPDSRRNFLVAFVQATYGVGAVLGGILAAFIIEDYGWRYVFGIGAILNFAILIPVFFLLPESLAFLLNKQPSGSLPAANKIIKELDGDTLENWPSVPESHSKSVIDIKSLLSKDLKKWTYLLWAAIFSALFGMYFILSWVPKIVFDAGLPLDKAIYVGISINAGGFVGSLWLGHRSATKGLRPMISLFFFLSGVLMIVFGMLSANAYILMSVAATLGFFALGAFMGLYSTAVRLYPTEIRATGIGWAIGLGRIGAIAGPFVGGLLISLGLGQAFLFGVLSIPFFIAAAAMWSMRAPQLLPVKT